MSTASFNESVDISIIKILLENGANLEVKNNIGETLLDRAIYKGNNKIINFLSSVSKNLPV